MSLRLLISVSAVLVSTGCSTVAVDRAQGVADTGTKYVETMKKVNDLALDKSITFTATLLARDVPRDDAVLQQTTDAIQERSKLVGSAAAYFDGLATYFAELEALAKGDQSAATSDALGKVADSLKAEPFGLTLSDDKKKALTGLAGFVAKQVHAAAVEKALTRDADTVAQALALSTQMLDEQIRWINVREAASRKKAFEDNVRKPFLTPSKELGDDWKKAWSDYVRTPPVIALLGEAKKASDDMQKAWRNVLRGQYSFAEIQASLNNVKAGIEALAALKEAK
jgi:hypothetical protein